MGIFYRLYLVFILGMTGLFASTGTIQEHLVNLNPSVNATDVLPTEVITVTFDKNILSKSIKKHSIKVKQLTPKKLKIQGNVLLQSNNTLAFMPSKPLEKGTYKVKVKPIKLLKEENTEIKPKTSWQKFIAWFCGLFYDDIADCKLCQYFCSTNSTVKTNVIKYTFEVKDNAPKVVMLKTNTTLVELSEHNTTQISVIATYEDNTTENVTQKATYSSDDSAVDVDNGVITTHDEGSAIITVSYANKTTTIKVEVYEMIDGHLLPHEPENPDETLLGVDENNNSVRDEVERWIYKDMPTYHHPEIERVIAMMKGKGHQLSLLNPTNKNDEVHKAIERASDCWSYYSYNRNLPFDASVQKFGNNLRDKSFNTKERLKTYMVYDSTLGGRIYTSVPLRLLNTSYCNQNIDVLP